MYPPTAGSPFNRDYYHGPHRELSRRLLSPRGLVRTEIDKGIGGIPTGGPPPYHAIGHLFFHNMADLQSAREAAVSEFVADERNDSSVPSVVQISEILE